MSVPSGMNNFGWASRTRTPEPLVPHYSHPPIEYSPIYADSSVAYNVTDSVGKECSFPTTNSGYLYIALNELLVMHAQPRKDINQIAMISYRIISSSSHLRRPERSIKLALQGRNTNNIGPCVASITARYVPGPLCGLLGSHLPSIPTGIPC